MRKLFVFCSGLLVLIGLAGPWFIGVFAETEARSFWRELSARQPQIRILTLDFQRGWFSSEQHVELQLEGLQSTEAAGLIVLNQRIQHGPLMIDASQPLEKALSVAAYSSRGSIDIISDSEAQGTQALPIIQFESETSLLGAGTSIAKAAAHKVSFNGPQAMEIAWSSLSNIYKTPSWRQPASSLSKFEADNFSISTPESSTKIDNTSVLILQQPDHHGKRGIEQLKLGVSGLLKEPIDKENGEALRIGNAVLRTNFFSAANQPKLSGNLRLEFNDLISGASKSADTLLNASFSQLTMARVSVTNILNWYVEHKDHDSRLQSLAQYAKAVLQSGFQANLEQLRYRSDGETSTARAKAALLPAAAETTTTEPSAWPKRAIASLNVDSSKRNLHALTTKPIAMRIARALKLYPKTLDKNDEQPQSLAHYWLTRGWLIEQGNRVSSITELQSGDLIINGEKNTKPANE